MNKLGKILAMSLTTLTLANSSTPIFAGRVMKKETLAQNSRKMSIEKPEKAEKPANFRMPKLQRTNTQMIEFAKAYPKLKWEKEHKDESVETIRELSTARLYAIEVTERVLNAAYAVSELGLTDENSLIKTAKQIISKYENDQEKLDKLREISEEAAGFMDSTGMRAKECHDIIDANFMFLQDIVNIRDLNDDAITLAEEMINFKKHYEYSHPNMKWCLKERKSDVD